MQQLELFTFPRHGRIELTREQRCALDILLLVDCSPLVRSGRMVRSRVLRRLLAMDCVACLSLSPACYRVTEIGRLARANANGAT
jgi:hypothetical protein